MLHIYHLFHCRAFLCRDICDEVFSGMKMAIKKVILDITDSCAFQFVCDGLCIDTFHPTLYPKVCLCSQC